MACQLCVKLEFEHSCEAAGGTEGAEGNVYRMQTQVFIKLIKRVFPNETRHHLLSSNSDINLGVSTFTRKQQHIIKALGHMRKGDFP